MASLDAKAEPGGGTALAGERGATDKPTPKTTAAARRRSAPIRYAANMSPIRVSSIEKTGGACPGKLKHAHAPDCGNAATAQGKLKAAIARNRGHAVTVKIG